jgi:hypothetical protein
MHAPDQERTEAVPTYYTIVEDFRRKHPCPISVRPEGGVALGFVCSVSQQHTCNRSADIVAVYDFRLLTWPVMWPVNVACYIAY